MDREKGSTLVSVIVIAGVAGVVMLAIASFSTFSARSTRSVSLSQDFNQLVSSVALVLNNKTACSLALLDKPFNASALPASPQSIETIALSGGTIAKVGEPPVGLKVTKLEIDKILMNLGPQSGGYNGYLVNLRLEAQKTGAPGNVAHVGNQFHQSDFTMTLNIDASNRIKQCY